MPPMLRERNHWIDKTRFERTKIQQAAPRLNRHLQRYADVSSSECENGQSDICWDGIEYTGSIKRCEQTPSRIVPSHIIQPDYAQDSIPKFLGHSSIIEVKNHSAIIGMMEVCKLARKVLDIAGQFVKPGITTDDIDALVHHETISRGAYPSPLNYRGFPKSVCTSVNEIACHGIPDKLVLKEGDIVNIDITAYYNGYHGDCSETFAVGDINDKTKELLQVTYDSWTRAMDYCSRPGLKYAGIGAVIEDYVVERGYETIRGYAGHGIGEAFHTIPNIYHYRTHVEDDDVLMEKGHVFTIEPMICEGKDEVVEWPDGWTTATRDGKRSAQFEHTLLMTNDGILPLTAKIPNESPLYPWERGKPYLGMGSCPLVSGGSE